MSFGTIIRAAREEQCWSTKRLSQEAGIDHAYVPKIERGFIPRRDVVERLASALELDPVHSLAHAGFVPEMGAEEWEAILLDLRTDQLHPDLRRALRGLQGLDAEDLRRADQVLVGTARGFRAARRRRAS